MKLMLEGNRKKILKLKKELKKRLSNDKIVTKEILPEIKKPIKKVEPQIKNIEPPIKEALIDKVNEPKIEVEKKVRRRRSK